MYIYQNKKMNIKFNTLKMWLSQELKDAINV